MADIIFTGQFIANKVGLNGIAVTVNVERVTRSDGTRLAIVTAGAINVVYGRNGLYGYRLVGADLTLYDYIATFITADATVDQQEIAAVWTYWSADGLEQADIISDATPFSGANIDAAISTRGTADPGDAMALTGAERIATAGVFLATILEGAHTVADGLRIMLAALAGKSTGGGTFTNRFRDVADSKNRIDATVDANGNRTAISIDGT